MSVVRLFVSPRLPASSRTGVVAGLARGGSATDAAPSPAIIACDQHTSTCRPLYYRVIPSVADSESALGAQCKG
jgi:hypothetical protein